MTRSTLLVASSLVCVIVGLSGVSPQVMAQSDAVPPYLKQYIEKPEPDFRWSLIETTQVNTSKVYQLELVSQKWQDIVWKHPLTVFEPEKVLYPHHMILFVTGGSTGKKNKPHEQQIGLGLAELSGARVAMLYHVPNQPLLGNRHEDDLISETWLRYLKTGDPDWPLLFPMAKSAVKAMDALQEFSRKQFQTEIQGFVTTGASKRGWTSWLVPAVDDRVIGTAPMVIDVLNFSAQMKHQKKNWGFFSEQISDYTTKGLVTDDGVPNGEREEKLWKMMDPYSYRQQVTVPKLLVVGANDRYWSTDAMNLYWDDLSGEKYACRIANAGHNLDDGKLSQSFVIQNVAIFFRHVVENKPLPQIEWTSTGDDNQLGLSITSSTKPITVRLWSARSENLDFRSSKWKATILTESNGTYTGSTELKSGEHQAIYGEVTFGNEIVPYSLSTLVYLK
ncbi:MAG TPA: PhoPQ-activated protein PqaA family protein [Planctomicrobium sp.]|nr:PhoPQ-activated protein PqaA family protein [Planctomicrobium sp.]